MGVLMTQKCIRYVQSYSGTVLVEVFQCRRMHIVDARRCQARDLRAASQLCVTIRLDESFVAWSVPLYRRVGGALQSTGRTSGGGVARPWRVSTDRGDTATPDCRLEVCDRDGAGCRSLQIGIGEPALGLTVAAAAASVSIAAAAAAAATRFDIFHSDTDTHARCFNGRQLIRIRRKSVVCISYKRLRWNQP